MFEGESFSFKRWKSSFLWVILDLSSSIVLDCWFVRFFFLYNVLYSRAGMFLWLACLAPVLALHTCKLAFDLSNIKMKQYSMKCPKVFVENFSNACALCIIGKKLRLKSFKLSKMKSYFHVFLTLTLNKLLLWLRILTSKICNRVSP